MIEDISTTKDVVKEIQVNTCDICNNEINTMKYLNVSSSNSSKNKKSATGVKNEEDDYNKYYNICLTCVAKIAELMKYNYGFDGRLIQFFELLTEKKLKKSFNGK